MQEKTWHIYIVECSDGTLYTGITKNVLDRVKRHNAGKGAKYTAERIPVSLKISCPLPGILNSQSNALKIERAIKSLPKALKIKAIQNYADFIEGCETLNTPEEFNYLEWIFKLNPGKFQSRYSKYDIKINPHKEKSTC